MPKTKTALLSGQAIVVETRRIGRGAVQDVIGSGTLEETDGRSPALARG